ENKTPGRVPGLRRGADRVGRVERPAVARDGRGFRRIISNNYDSVVAAQEMKESLERQDSAALFALLGARDKAKAQLHEHRERFDANFQKAANNITELGEPDAIEAIRRDRDAYY